jgi:hypothetical protein
LGTTDAWHQDFLTRNPNYPYIVVKRDTTLQAFDGCLFGPATGWCGLRGQLLVRIGPPDGGADPCALARHYGLPIAPAPSGTPR